LELAKELPQPDIILLDVMMPDLDGYEVCSRLKLDPTTCDIPVIFLTGKIEAEDETKGFKLGAVDYIHKPFSPAVVQARVQTHLTLREAREQLAQEKRKVDRLLENILPAAAVVEIKKTGSVIPRRFENVAVLFADLVAFTTYCDQHSPEEVVRDLGDLFVAFEECVSSHGLEKIKSIGDAFLQRQGCSSRWPILARRGDLRLGDLQSGWPEQARLAGQVRRSHGTGHGRDRGPRALPVRHLG
jgi:response regulator RpfG family c-di-GMP phosphodiesterase